MLATNETPMAEFNSEFLDADEFSDAIGNLDVPWSVGVTSTKFNAHVRRRTFVDCTLGEMRFGPCTGVRNNSQISRKGGGYIGLSYLRRGNVTFLQGSNNIVVERGDMLLWDGATPSMFINPGLSQFELIWLPLALVERRVGPVRGSLGQSVSCNDGVALLLSQYIQNLHRTIGEISPITQKRVIEATIDLIFACFNRDVNQSADVPAFREDLLAAAEAEIAQRIWSGAVSPAEVADKLGISVRYLQKVFAMSGRTFSGHVANERLEYARKLLCGWGGKAPALTEIAHLAGYCDLSHLSRAFKRHYGMSPSVYRLNQ